MEGCLTDVPFALLLFGSLFFVLNVVVDFGAPKGPWPQLIRQETIETTPILEIFYLNQLPPPPLL